MSRVRNAPIIIYLAGPVDGVSPEEAREWREAVGSQAPSGAAFFSPVHAWFGDNKQTIPGIDTVNRWVIANCHGLLAHMPKISFGTVREIEFAVRQNVPVVAVSGVVGDSLLSYDIEVANSLEEGVTKLLEKITSSRNEPPMIAGFPVAQLRPMTQEEIDEQGDEGAV